MSVLVRTLFVQLSTIFSAGRKAERFSGRAIWLSGENGTDAAPPDGFQDYPSRAAALWFDMDWRGATYLAMGDDPRSEAAFAPLGDLARASVHGPGRARHATIVCPTASAAKSPPHR